MRNRAGPNPGRIPRPGRKVGALLPGQAENGLGPESRRGRFRDESKIGGPAQFRPGKRSKLEAKSREKINKPADFALGVGGYFSVESRAESRQKLTGPLIFDAKNQAAAGRRPRSRDVRTGLCGHLPKTRSGGPCETPPKLEILPRTRSSAVGRAIPAAFCKLGPKIGETVGPAASAGGLGGGRFSAGFPLQI